MNTNRGVTIFFAILIIGLLLSIGFSISLLAQKQLGLSTLSAQSELSFYAADASVECVEYWDKNGSPDPFDPTNSSPSSIGCFNQSIDVTPLNPDAGTTTAGLTREFMVYLNKNDTTNGQCADVTVSKTQENGVWVTSIESRGYNTCNSSSPYKLERAIFVSY